MNLKYLKSYKILFLNGLRVMSFFLLYKIIFSNWGNDVSSAYATIDSYTILLGSFCLFGFNASVMRIFNDFDGNISSFLINYVKISSAIFLIILSLFSFTSLNKSIDFFYFLPFFLILFIVTNYFTGALKAYNKVMLANIFDSLFPITFVGVIFFISYFDFQPSIIFYSWILVKAFFLSCLIYFLLKNITKKPPSTIKDLNVYSIVKISHPIFISSLSVIIFSEIPVIYLSLFSNSTQVLSFKIAMKIASILWMVQFSFYNILFPKIPKLFKEKSFDKLSAIVRSQTLGSFRINILIFFLILVFGKYLLFALSGDDLLDFNVLAILAFTFFMNSMFGPIETIFQTTIYQKIHMKLMLFLLLFFIFFAYVLINYGAIGISISYFFTFLIRNIFARWFFIKKFGVKLTLL
jgi:O-antigen/teichoic acid export membrane protein